MHARQWITVGDDGRFRVREFGQSYLNEIRFGKQLCQTNIGGVVTSFRFEQAAVEPGKLLILYMLAQQIETLTRSRFDQARDQQSIDRTPRFLFANLFMQPASVATGPESSKGDTPT